jgi:hypothetical protein
MKIKLLNIDMIRQMGGCFVDLNPNQAQRLIDKKLAIEVVEKNVKLELEELELEDEIPVESIIPAGVRIPDKEDGLFPQIHME